MDNIKYSAKLSGFDKPSIIKITISQETARTIRISHKKPIIGETHLQYFGKKRVFKDGLTLFDTLVEAIEYLIEQLLKENEFYQKSIDFNEKSLNELRSFR